MNIAQIIHPYAPILLAAISMLLLLLAALYGRPWMAGIVGNARIQREIGLLRKKGAMVLDQLQLTTKSGDIVHIDHLIISNTQVIAISTIGYTGEVMGSIRAPQWTQETPQGAKRIPNPLKEHELILQTIQAALGTRLKIRAISAFTAARLSTDSRDIVPAAVCAKSIHEAIEGTVAGPKQQWAANIIRNVALSGKDSKAEKERTFIARQGNESQFKAARYLLITSAVSMVIAMILAGLRLAATHGLI